MSLTPLSRCKTCCCYFRCASLAHTPIYPAIMLQDLLLLLQVRLYIYVLILLYMCPHATIYVSSYHCICVLILLYILQKLLRMLQVLLCVLMPVLLCISLPHTPIYLAAAYQYICVLMPVLLCISLPHTPPTYLAPSYHYTYVLILLCVLILLYVSSYYYMCPRLECCLREISLSLSLHTHTQSKELIGVLFTRELVVKTWNNFIAQRAPSIGSLKRQVQQPRAIYVYVV
jgi:hypothetical protein